MQQRVTGKMNNRVKHIDEALAGNMPLQKEEAMAIVGEYPYFTPVAVALLKEDCGLSQEEREKVTALAATSIPDREELFNHIGKDADKFADFYPEEEKGAESTMDTISHFLDTFGNDDENEIKALEQLIFNPVPDYAQLLAKEEEGSAPAEGELDAANMSEKDLRINKFIAKSKKQSGRFPTEGREEVVPYEVTEAPSPKVAGDNADSSLLTESLAKIYIRQHRYEKALEIIMSLSLNFPEKSIYFADQMRFLKKLIANEKYKQKN